MVAFLELNGYGLAVSQGEIPDTMVAVAEGEMQLSALAQWLRAGSRPIA